MDLERRLILGLGTGRCGTHALAWLLDRQPESRVTHEEPPLLPWKRPAGESAIRARLARWRRERAERVVGDVAWFYLPYVEEALAAEPEVRVIGLWRPCEEVVASFRRWLDTVHPLPTNHWAERPGPGWHHDPIWTRIFPQYDLVDREAGIRRYWDEYYAELETLAGRHPQRVRVFPTDEALNTEAGQRALLSFVGVPDERQIVEPGVRTHQAEQARRHPRREGALAEQANVAGTLRAPSAQSRLSLRESSVTFAERKATFGPYLDSADGTQSVPATRCVVLVPYGTHIVADCEKGLKELERRGYPVRRVRGYAAIDQGRNQMATDALIESFEETLWIDSDIGFDPDAVERLRAHREPIVCGIYPQKGRRALACHLLPGTKKLVFGQGGGLVEILYAGAGFLLVRREVYSQMQRQLELPVCNERFGRPTIPFFQPLALPSDDGFWYLAEDYSFCERAGRCGYRVLADTTLRLWHVGQYAYGCEDAGVAPQRYGSFTYYVE